LVARLTLAPILFLALFVVGCGPAAEPGPEPFRLLDNLGNLHRSITTSSEEAQRYFDQGLIFTFGFNHNAAIRSFEECARLDPEAAMCHWGKAYALGPNINMPMGPDAAVEAFASVQRALALAPGASPEEQAYIAALAKRYSDDPKAERAALDRAYANAMGEVSKRYPDDLDAATLYAEALMDLNPWNHWTPEGEPVAETPEIVATLESVIKRNPDHPGANHYYIHAVEASKTPERAEPAADRLGSFAPGQGHLVHMPSHIYIRVGRYNDAAEINKRAAIADEEYFAWCQSQGIYRALYYPHNVHFLWAAASADGQSEVALIASRKLVQQVPKDQFGEYPFLEDFMPTPIFTLIRFGRWDAVLGEPQPDPRRRYETGIWRYAQGLAQTRKGHLQAAEAQHALLVRMAGEEGLGKLEFFGGTARENLRIASHHLAGEIAASKGEYKGAVEEIEKAVALQDALKYTEPPPWFFPTRQALGAVLLNAGRPAEAEEVYLADLARNPRNGWSLFGLSKSLEAQGKTDEAALVREGFTEAWGRADVKLESSTF
jgi:tetratricopeptide (TPR) repeat protein